MAAEKSDIDRYPQKVSAADLAALEYAFAASPDFDPSAGYEPIDLIDLTKLEAYANGRRRRNAMPPVLGHFALRRGDVQLNQQM